MGFLFHFKVYVFHFSQAAFVATGREQRTEGEEEIRV